MYDTEHWSFDSLFTFSFNFNIALLEVGSTEACLAKKLQQNWIHSINRLNLIDSIKFTRLIDRKHILFDLLHFHEKFDYSLFHLMPRG